ncbi:MAG: hypothetical protein KKA64_04545 [Nanoarchaeota archaeon]|nr:hypothetical protein [Nanoarchaeota archaeon]
MAYKRKNKFDEETIKKITKLLQEIKVNRNEIVHNNIIRTNQNINKDKRRLIGILPSLLMDKKYFPRNEMIADFAEKKLKISIPSPHKKKRAELMGRIIEDINRQPNERILLLSQAFDKLIGKEEKEGITNFFLEWNKAIGES